MARYALIDSYLDTMRTTVRWRHDVDDLVAEMEDHLYSAVEGLCAGGVDPAAAERTTLDRFGDPQVLATAFASTHQGGLAVPTRFTQRAGTFALTAATLWLAASAAYTLHVVFSESWQLYYGIFSLAVLLAGGFGVGALMGLGKRVGGLGTLGMIGLVVTGLGVIASIVAWAVPAWMTIQGLGLLLVGVAALGTNTAPRPALRLMASGFLIGPAIFTVGTLFEIGWRDVHGDYPVAWTAGSLVGTGIVAAGLVGVGLWLRAEEPVDLDPTPIVA